MKTRNILTEAFNLSKGKFAAKDGKTYNVIMIDPATSESTFPFKDEIKKFGAVWLKAAKTWGWFLNDNERDTDVYENKIKPCLTYLLSVEDSGANTRAHKECQIIDELIGKLSVNIESSSIPSANEVKAKLKAFKEELVNCYDDEEFKAKIEPLIKFNQALGHAYSFRNVILIYVQDPKATMVKSRTRWAALNRRIKPNADHIKLFRSDNKPLTTNQKQAIQGAYLRSVGVNSVTELNPGQKEELSVRLNSGDSRGFVAYEAYDIRFTEQIENTEDLVGNKVELEWFDDSSDETEKTVKLIEALKSIIQEAGISLGEVNDMGGARGVSRSGKIDILSGAKKNESLFQTLVHEFSHELLHQRFLSRSKDPNNAEWAKFFIGTEQGRKAVEQQAELSAWIVCKFFDINDQTAINYMTIWGMDKANAPRVFDTVAQVATQIHQKICEKLQK